MVKKVLVASCALMVCAVMASSATAREFADIYTDCGIGAIIAPRNAAVAAVTNVTWDLGTTAISSDISSPESCKGGQGRSAAFIYHSYDFLEGDLATGEGEYLDVLTVLAGCEPEGRDEFLSALRTSFADHVANTNYTEQTRYQKAEVLYNLVYEQVGSTL